MSFVDYNGVVTVAFDESNCWRGHLRELKPIPAAQLSTKDLEHRALRQGISQHQLQATALSHDDEKNHLLALVTERAKWVEDEHKADEALPAVREFALKLQSGEASKKAQAALGLCVKICSHSNREVVLNAGGLQSLFDMIKDG